MSEEVALNCFALHGYDLELTRRCNLRCGYCYHGKHNSNDTASQDTLDLMVEFVRRKTPAGQQASIVFYGGEPLLAFDELQYVVRRLRDGGVRCRYTVTTNGTIGTPAIAAFFRLNRIKVVRSIDGCPEAMDLNRAGAIEDYKRCTEIYRDYGVGRRCTISPNAAHLLVKSLHYLNDITGTKSHCQQPDFYATWTEEQARDFIGQLREIGREYVADTRAGRPFYSFWFDRAKAVLTDDNPKPRFGCGAGDGAVAINWAGYLFPCHRFTTEPIDGPLCAGNIADLMDKPVQFGEQWQEYLAFCKSAKLPESCDGCTARAGCGIGCSHVNLKTTGSLSTPNPLWCRFRREAVAIVKDIDNELRPTHPQWFTPKRNTQRRRNMSAVSQDIAAWEATVRQSQPPGTIAILVAVRDGKTHLLTPFDSRRFHDKDIPTAMRLVQAEFSRMVERSARKNAAIV